MPANRPAHKPSVRSTPSSLLLKSEMDKLVSQGILASPLVTEHFQEGAQRWVLEAKEAGGSLGAHGYYVGIAAAGDVPPLLSLPINTFMPNQVHRRVVGLDLVIIEMYRYMTTCSLSIVRHSIVPRESGKPSSVSVEMFRGLQGLLEDGSRDPSFYSASGESLSPPSMLVPLIRAASKAVRCDGCRHAHFLTIPPLMLEPVANVAGSPETAQPATHKPSVAPHSTPVPQTSSRKPRASVIVEAIQ